MFREASQNRIFQDVVNQIQDAILDGKIKTGDILPSERELKEMFNTSRGTLREALRVLEARGLIEIRLGVHGGAKVKDVTTVQAAETLALLIKSQKVSLDHLSEFREGMEGNVASLAARRATEIDIRGLEKYLEEARGYIEEESIDRDAFIEVDKNFHMKLAEISHNPVYIFVFHSIHENIHRYYDRFLSMEYDRLKENYQDLCSIKNAVEGKRADEARVLAQSHVIRFHRYMKLKEQKENKTEIVK